MFKSVNPATNELLQEFPVLNRDEINQRIEFSKSGFQAWNELSLEERAARIRSVGESLKKNKSELADLITVEMGKPVSQSEAEIKKCAWLCEYYADNGPGYLRAKIIKTEAKNSYLRYDPLGLIMGIMPWNFPCWQAFRFAIPAMMAGNVVFLKPAPNVPRISNRISELITTELKITGVFQTVFLEVDDISEVLEHPFLQGVALTGSDRAGAAVAEKAGSLIKRCVLELGGSDPFLVLDDADLKQAAKIAAESRMNNTGQTCIAAKRLIIQDSIYEEFMEHFIREVKALKLGDPGDKDTDLGPLARRDILKQLNEQVVSSIRKGAVVRMEGGPNDGKGNYYRPTILENITPGMPAYEEEVFGPVALVFKVNSHDEMISLANDSKYGLGASIWSADLQLAEQIASEIHSGAIAINGMVKSDPRMPFGGVKRSGFGRELGEEGLKEFVNIKSVTIEN